MADKFENVLITVTLKFPYLFLFLHPIRAAFMTERNICLIGNMMSIIFHICIFSLQLTTVRQLTQINGWIAVSLESIVPPAKKGAAAMKRTAHTGASILQVSTVNVGIFACCLLARCFSITRTRLFLVFISSFS